MTEPVPVVPTALSSPPPIEATVPLPAPEVPWTPEYLNPRHDEELYTEYGLQTPDGTIHWGKFHNLDVSTPESRFQMRLNLRRTATEIGYDPDTFVAQYRWVGRVVDQKTDRVFTDAGIVSLDSDAAAPPPSQNGQPVQ